MAHGHDHSHDHGPEGYNRAFALGVGLNLAYALVEAGVGMAIGSLALVADAGHNLSDVMSLLLAWGAEALRGRPRTARRTYGYRKVSILAALAGGILLVTAMGAVIWEAVMRFGAPAVPEGWSVLVVAGIGVLVNTASALLFISGQKSDLNVRSAFLHLAADAAVSLGVVVAGWLILVTGKAWIDPAVSLAVGVLVLISTWGLLRDSAVLAIDAVPPGIDPDRVREYLLSLDGVTDLHDLHIWGISTRDTALTVHLVMPGGSPGDAFLQKVAGELEERFAIHHATIQVEEGTRSECCSLVPLRHGP